MKHDYMARDLVSCHFILLAATLVLLAAMLVACGPQTDFDHLEISTGRADQAQLNATNIVLNAKYESILEPEEPHVFILLLHEGDNISIILESLDGKIHPWVELYRGELGLDHIVTTINDLEDSKIAKYQIRHPWRTPFRQKYYVKVINTSSEERDRFRLQIKCNSGPCEEDPAGDLLTDRFEPNNTRYLSRLHVGTETDLLNLDSGSDVDWLKIPVYKFTTAYVNAVAVGLDGEPLEGVQISAWYECTRGQNASTCNMYSPELSYFSYVYPELGPVPGCRGDNTVSLKRNCRNDYGRHGQLFVRVSWDPQSTNQFAYYQIQVN